jgi:heat shock protein HslJ
MKKSIFLLLLLAACSPKQETKTNEPITIQKVMGVYTGVTPCADCEGIYTHIEFIDSVTYIKSSKYLGKSSRAFLDMGEWSIQNDSIIALTTHGKTHRYLHEGSNIIMLDTEGKRIQGTLANYYRLAKGEPEGTRNWSEATTRGIDFVAQGNEPSWNLEIDFDKELRFTTLDGDSVVLPTPATTPEGSSTTLVVTERNTALKIKLSPVGCINSSSGLYSDYRIEITMNNTSMKGCGEFINEGYQLQGRWVLTSMNAETININDYEKGAPELSFSVTDKKVNGFTGCNRLSGGFTLGDNKSLKFLPLVITRMFCSGKDEAQFLKALETITAYRIEADKLLLLREQQDVLVFTIRE